MASLKEMLFGKKGKIEALPTLSPEQQQLLGQLLGGLGGPIQSGLGNLQSLLSGDMEAYEAPAMRQFQEQIVPGIAERFTGMGAGAQQSSAFGQQLGAAGAGLAERLAMQRAGLQQQGLGQLQSLLGMGIGTPTYQWMGMPGTQGGLGSLASGFGSSLGMGGGYGLLKLLGLGG